MGFNGSTATAAANVVGQQTYAVLVQLLYPDASVVSAAMVAVEHQAVASATHGQLVKSSDPPQVIGCAPGDTISVLGMDAETGSLYITELT